jgi:hypothetical protein
MDVRIASENDKETWNQFVDRAGGSFHHYFEWKYYYEKNPSKHRFIPLIIEDDSSDILGIFPIEENFRSLYGYLTSLPLGVSNGFLLKSDLTDQGKKTVIKSFLDYVDTNYSRSHSSCTIREYLSFSEGSRPPTQILMDNGYHWFDNTITQFPCTYILKLEKPFEQKIWMGLMDKSLRRRIRQARKNGAEVVIDNDFTYLDDFVEMQIQSYEKFGHFPTNDDIKSIFSIFRKKIKLFVCLQDSRPISAALCYYTPTMVHCSMAPYNSLAKDYLSNTLPICASMRHACEHGYTYYDHGLTNTPEIAYHKEKFGAIRIPLRIYTKKFSPFKVIANETYDSIKQGGKNLVRAFKR